MTLYIIDSVSLQLQTAETTSGYLEEFTKRYAACRLKGTVEKTRGGPKRKQTFKSLNSWNDLTAILRQ